MSLLLCEMSLFWSEVGDTVLSVDNVCCGFSRAWEVLSTLDLQKGIKCLESMKYLARTYECSGFNL